MYSVLAPVFASLSQVLGYDLRAIVGAKVFRYSLH